MACSFPTPGGERPQRSRHRENTWTVRATPEAAGGKARRGWFQSSLTQLLPGPDSRVEPTKSPTLSQTYPGRGPFLPATSLPAAASSTYARARNRDAPRRWKGGEAGGWWAGRSQGRRWAGGGGRPVTLVSARARVLPRAGLCSKPEAQLQTCTPACRGPRLAGFPALERKRNRASAVPLYRALVIFWVSVWMTPA
jgi:hypothetical protein